MNQSKSDNIRTSKHLARKGYAERQFERWVKWSFDTHGKVLFKDLIKKQIEYNIIKE
tara:strand:+ start:389 stop:559 length:171 start_codon:yes stop_codon:yes gene_type:complete